MSALATLIRDVDAAAEHGSDALRARVLSLVTELLVREDGRLGHEQIELFDDVLGRFTLRVDAPARAVLAERVAGLRRGPPNIVRSLAFDDSIAVAGPILARSRQLDDQELMAVAQKGPIYRLAICRRPTIAESVTDLLVELGGRDVHLAVASNYGAALSEQSTALLIDYCRDDEALQISIGDRHDLSPVASRRLVEYTRDLARRQILAGMAAESATAAEPDPVALPAIAMDEARSAETRAGGRRGRDYRRAALSVRKLADERPLTEADLVAFAAGGMQAEAICTVAGLVGLSVAAAERLCDGSDFDLILLVAKAQNWSWPTFAALIAEFWPAASEGRQISRTEERFAAMTGPKARRMLQFRQLGSGPSPSRVPRPIKPA